MTIANTIARTGAALLVGCLAQPAFAENLLAAYAAEDGAVDAARQCDVYIAGATASTRPDPLAYRWLAGDAELSSWRAVRADGTAPLELCGLPTGRHTLTLEVTDGERVVSDTMTATIAPALVARGGDAPQR